MALFAITGGVHGIACLFQRILQLATQIGFVFDDQYSHWPLSTKMLGTIKPAPVRLAALPAPPWRFSKTLPAPNGGASTGIHINIDQIAILQEPKPVRAAGLIKLHANIITPVFLHHTVLDRFQRHDLPSPHHVVHVIGASEGRCRSQQGQA
jgi:hypothetical protein